METINHPETDRSWQAVVLKYTRPDLRKSIWQICNSLIPYSIMWYLMYRSLVYPYWTTILLSMIAAGFLIRLFIIFHDCGHGSFFRSKKANDTVGMVFGVLTFTPYYPWHNQHRIHHATAGNLDKRGIGDVWTLTVEEYLKSSKWRRFLYRTFRNPFILFTFGPVILLVQQRFTTKQMTRGAKQNVYFTNAVILLVAALISLMMGLKAYLLIQLPIILVGYCVGIWLFYIQHQFDEVFWDRNTKWDYKTAAIAGSSFLKLSPILQWFTGNIGFHHVHHLSSRIPNYNLARCHYENDIFKDIKPIVLFSTLKALKLSLWDEANHQMISFKRISVSI